MDSREDGPVQSWIREAQGGDDEAFDRLARHYLPRLRRWALVRTGDPDDAEDVVQRTLVAMYRKLDSFRGDADFGSWLYRITGNEATALFRRRGSRRRALDRLVALGGRKTVQEPSAPEEGVADLLRSFLTELSERQREMMDLVDFQGFTPSEAAERLGLAPSTARVHLLRARRQMRERILEDHAELVEEIR